MKPANGLPIICKRADFPGEPFIVAPTGARLSKKEEIGYIGTDSGVDENNTDFIEEDVEYTKVPFRVSTPPDFYNRVHASDNNLGLTGAWYVFNDEVGTWNTLYYDDQWNSCARGQVAEFIPGFTNWTYAGIGTGLCYDPEENINCYPLSNCPYFEDVDFEIVGVSFEIYSNIPGDLKLEFYHQSTKTSAYVDIPRDAGNRTYLLKDTKIAGSNETLPFEKTSNIQIQVKNADNRPVPFDYCVRDFSLLVK